MFKFIYSALLTQEGENPPEVSLLQEGIKGTEWLRTAPGKYIFRRNRSFFKYHKDFPQNTLTLKQPNGDQITIEETSTNEITLQTFAANDHETPVDGILKDYFFGYSIPRVSMYI
jgi:hypothetical protein